MPGVPTRGPDDRYTGLTGPVPLDLARAPTGPDRPRWHTARMLIAKSLLLFALAAVAEMAAPGWSARA